MIWDCQQTGYVVILFMVPFLLVFGFGAQVVFKSSEITDFYSLGILAIYIFSLLFFNLFISSPPWFPLSISVMIYSQFLSINVNSSIFQNSTFTPSILSDVGEKLKTMSEKWLLHYLPNKPLLPLTLRKRKSQKGK